MIYLKCPTCGRNIASRQKIYDEKLKEINDKNISIDEKEHLNTELINSLKLNKICCKMRVMMKHDLINIIV
jgi:DNA-directed RNA polymerase subunit N (RpoN/RPB10)